MKKFYQTNHFYLLAIFMSLAFLIRYQFILDQSYWMDELYSAARSIPSKSFENVYYWGPDPHPPLHYILLWITYKFFGFTEHAGRMLSIVAGVLIIPAVYFLGKEIFNKQTGFLSSLAVTFNPILFFFSLEARSYELLALFSVISSYLFIKCISKPSYFRSFIYLLSLIILINLHFFGFLVLASQAATYFIFCIKTNSFKLWKYIFLPIFFATLSYLPLLHLAMEISGNGPTWIQTENVFSFIQNTFVYFIVGSSTSLSTQINMILGNILLVYLICLFGYLFAKDFNLKYLLILMTFIFTFFISYLIGFVLNPIFNARNAIIYLPFLVITISFGISLISHQFCKIFGLPVFFIIFLLPFFFYKIPPKQDWRNALLSASELSDTIHVPGWIGQWDVYKKWLNLKNLKLIPLSHLNKNDIKTNEKIFVIWAHIEPQSFENVKNIPSNFTIEDKIDLYSSGIHIYSRTSNDQ